MYYVDNLDTIWVDPFDIFLSTKLLSQAESNICEIGVYKGGYLISVLMNLPKSKALAIDPFPGLEEIKNLFIKNININNLTDRVKLYDKYSEIYDYKFDLIHIDGEHSEAAVLKDLEFAIANLSTQGFIVIDDIWHPKFPGIISACLKSIHKDLLSPFLISKNKMYLCLPSQYGFYNFLSKQLLLKNNIRFSESLMKGDSIRGEAATFSQSNAINGYELLLIDRISKAEQLKVLGLSQNNQLERLKMCINFLVPPFVIFLAKKILLVIKNTLA